MSEYQQRENSGALFKNESKEQPNHCDYQGSINVAGTDYWINAWLKKSKNGKNFMSLSVKPKTPQQGYTNKRDFEEEEPPF